MANAVSTTRRAVLKAFPMFGVAAVAASVPAEAASVEQDNPLTTPVDRMEAAMTELRSAMAAYMADKEGHCAATVTWGRDQPGRWFVHRIYDDANQNIGIGIDVII